MSYSGRQKWQHAAPLITSRHNPRVVRWRDWVHSSAVRRRSDWILLEGPHLITAALERGIPLREVWVEQSAAARWASLLERVQALGVAVVLVSRSVLEAVCDTTTPQGVVAEAVKPVTPAVDLRGDLVILDGVQEPGNVGAILRVAAAAGVATVWLAPGSAQAWAPKTLRAAMGAHFAVAIGEGEVPEAVWRPFAEAGRLWATVLAGRSSSLYALDLRKPLAWIFGSEGQGVSHIWQERSSGLVRLPINPAVESLNVASAAAVFCFEAVRQRNQWLC